MAMLYSFGYRMLRGAGGKFRQLSSEAYDAVREVQGSFSDNHQVVAVLDDWDEYEVKQGEFLYLTDGMIFACPRVLMGDNSMLYLEARDAERVFLRGDMPNSHQMQLAFACYLTEDTRWMGDEFLVWLSEEWRGLFKR